MPNRAPDAEPGFTVIRVEMNLYVDGPIQAWQDFARKVGLVNQEPGRLVVSFASIGDLTEGRGPALYGEIHVATGVGEEPSAVHWHLIFRAGAAAPPPSVQRQSEALGGYPNIIERFWFAWPAAVSRQCAGDFTCSLMIPEGTELRLPVPRPTRWQPKAGKSFRMTPLSQSWALHPPSGIVTNITADAAGDREVVVTEGEWRGELSKRMFDNLAENAWQGLQPFVRNRVSRTARGTGRAKPSARRKQK